MTVSVAAELMDNEADELGIQVKIATDAFEINVWLRRDEVDHLEKVPSAVWEERGALRIGETLGSPVFWCSSERGIDILIGADQELWAVGVHVPHSALDEIRREVAAACRELGDQWT